MQNMNNIWTVIAAYNEEKNISDVIDKTKKFCSNIIVVDDGSKDNTFKAVKSKDIHVLKHIVNLGKGGAIKTGCDFALDKGAEVLILVDGDGQHNPEYIPNFIQALENKDIVFGYRKFSEKMPFIYRLGNTIINQTLVGESVVDLSRLKFDASFSNVKNYNSKSKNNYPLAA